MPIRRLVLGDLEIDKPDFLTPGILQALNVYPRRASYGPFKTFSRVSQNALTGRVLGAHNATNSSNNAFIYAGDATKLYEMPLDQTFADVSGTTYGAAADPGWNFTTWSYNEQVIATNYTDPVQELAIGNGATSNFADLITSTLKPKAKYVAVVWPAFLVLGWTNDGTDGVTPNRIWWSAYRDPTDFDPDASTQCDYENLATGGAVTNVVGMVQYGLIFQDNMIRTMQYVGPGPVFEITPIEASHGTYIPRSVVAHGRDCFAIDEEGFLAVRDGQVHRIGDGYVDRRFNEEFSAINAAGVSAAHDDKNRVVAWLYPGSGSTGDVPNKLLMCKYDQMRWAEAEIDLHYVLTTETQGYTLEGLDNLTTDIDDGSLASLDDPRYAGGEQRFSGFDTANQFGTFTGPTAAARITTTDFEGAQHGRGKVTWVRPLVEGGNTTGESYVSVSGRSALQDAVTFDTSVATLANGEAPVRTEGRYLRVQVSLSASTSWSHIYGLDIDVQPTGRW